MPKVIFCKGIPASGKSVAARRLAHEENYVRVSRDDFRSMMGEYHNFTDERERLVKTLSEQMILTAVKAGRNVIVDETNLFVQTPKRIATLLWEEGLDVTYDILDFTDVMIYECLARDKARGEAGGISVGPVVIGRMAKKLNSPKSKWTVADLTADLPTLVPYVADYSLPPAIMCDIDNTLALKGNRGPYDFDRLDEDEPNHPVLWFLRATAENDTLHPLEATAIILCSGRDERYRETTEKWLHDHDIPYDHLFMRRRGDQRRDSIIKYELFDEHIRPFWHVRCVLDDRDRVVKVWRNVGLPVWQVNDGAF